MFILSTKWPPDCSNLLFRARRTTTHSQINMLSWFSGFSCRAVARDGKVGGVLLLILPTEGRGFGCGFFLIRFLFLQPLPALALIVVHWNHFMWSKGTCARLYLAISDRYGYCELCFKNPSEIKSKVKWWKLWGYISWWESTFSVKLCREVRECYWEINVSYRLLATILISENCWQHLTSW